MVRSDRSRSSQAGHGKIRQVAVRSGRSRSVHYRERSLVGKLQVRQVAVRSGRSRSGQTGHGQFSTEKGHLQVKRFRS